MLISNSFIESEGVTGDMFILLSNSLLIMWDKTLEGSS